MFLKRQVKKVDGALYEYWALDRGMVSEENLDWLRGRKALYLVGTPKARLKRHEALLLAHLGLQLPKKPKILGNVVPKIAS